MEMLGGSVPVHYTDLVKYTSHRKYHYEVIKSCKTCSYDEIQIANYFEGVNVNKFKI